MKAIIPCAGRGKRLRPLTFTNSKPVIPIANRPLVYYAIDKLKQVGITDIGIVVSDNTQDMKDVLNSGKDLGVSISYIQQDQPQGVAHTIKVSRDFLGDEPFIMYLGDNLLQEGLQEAVNEFQSDGANGVIFVSPTNKPELYGIVVIENNRVVKLVEKPKNPPSNLAAVGIYILDPGIHKIVEDLKPSARGELEITDALQGLVDSGARLKHHICKGWWIDAGNPDDMIEANRLVLQDLPMNIQGHLDLNSHLTGNVVLGKNSVVENSTIRGPVIIGSNCKIKNCFVGSFTSIGNDSELDTCEIEYSVVMENCKIRNVRERIDYSIIGRNVTITSGIRKPKSYKLVLSDDSAAELL